MNYFTVAIQEQGVDKGDLTTGHLYADALNVGDLVTVDTGAGAEASGTVVEIFEEVEFKGA